MRIDGSAIEESKYISAINAFYASVVRLHGINQCDDITKEHSTLQDCVHQAVQVRVVHNDPVLARDIYIDCVVVYFDGVL